MNAFKAIWMVGAGALLMLFASAASAQDVAGKWEGTLNYAPGYNFDGMEYDWDFKKWSKYTGIYDIKLELTPIRDGKYTGTYFMNCKGCTKPSKFRFDAVFTDPNLVGSTEGLPLENTGNNPAYMEL